MTRRLICVLSLALVTLTLVACSGPTKTGLEARDQAHGRMNLMNARVHYDQAKRSFEVGQFQKAMQEIDKAISRKDDQPQYYILRGRILLEQHRLEGALASISSAFEHDPQSAEAHYYAGIIYQRWSNNEKAYEHYMNAFEHDSTNVQYLLAAAESMIDMDDDAGAEELIVQHMSYFEHNAAMRHLLAHIALLRDDAKTAASHLREARMLNPTDDVLLEELAWAKYVAGQYARSYETIRELLARIDEPRLELRLLEARCLTFLDRKREARALYLELSRKHPSEPNVWIELGSLAWQIRDFQRVSIAGSRAVALAPERYEGYLLQALHAREHGEIEQATLLVKQAAERAHDTALPHLLLGRTLEDAGEHEEALAAYGEALRIEPENDQANRLFANLSEKTQITTVPVN